MRRQSGDENRQCNQRRAMALSRGAAIITVVPSATRERPLVIDMMQQRAADGSLAHRPALMAVFGELSDDGGDGGRSPGTSDLDDQRYRQNRSCLTDRTSWRSP